MDIRLKGGKVLDIPAGIHSKNKAKSLVLRTFSVLLFRNRLGLIF